MYIYVIFMTLVSVLVIVERTVNLIRFRNQIEMVTEALEDAGLQARTETLYRMIAERKLDRTITNEFERQLK